MYRIYFEDFHLDISCNPDQIKSEVFKVLKTHHFRSVTNAEWSQLLEDYIWERDRPVYFPVSIEVLPECDGCFYNCLGQKDHMGPGGCLSQS